MGDEGQWINHTSRESKCTQTNQPHTLSDSSQRSRRPCCVRSTFGPFQVQQVQQIQRHFQISKTLLQPLILIRLCDHTPLILLPPFGSQRAKKRLKTASHTFLHPLPVIMILRSASPSGLINANQPKMLSFFESKTTSTSISPFHFSRQ